MSIFSTFTTDSELTVHPKMLVNIPIFIDLLQSEDDTIANDAFQCLEAINGQEKGRIALLECNAIDKFCSMYREKSDRGTQVFSLLMGILSSDISGNWISNNDHFHSFMEKLATEFESSNDKYKFHVCEMLTSVLLCVSQRNLGLSPKWIKPIHKGLADIFKSKLGSEQRNPALKLAAAMFNVFGESWTWTGEESGVQETQLLLLVTNLACVEVRMILEDRTFDQICSQSSLLISCYVVVENLIMLIVKESCPVSQKAKQQLYGALKGAANAIMTFLESVSKENGGQWKDFSETKVSILYASIRVIAAWLAEDTEALREQVYNTLPFLLDVISVNAKSNMSEKSDNALDCANEDNDYEMSELTISQTVPDLLRIILPALCHLSAELTPLNIILSANFHEVLIGNIKYHWERFNAGRHENTEESDDSEIALITLCGILMNIAVVRSDFIPTNPMFAKICKYILSKAQEIDRKPQHILLLGNFSVLGLLLLRNINIGEDCSSEFGRCIPSVTRFLWEAHERLGCKLVISTMYVSNWDELGDLWFVGMSTLTTLISRIPWITEFIKESGWLQDIVRTLAGISVVGIEASILSAYNEFLCSLLQQDKTVKTIILDNDGKTLCKTHKLLQLQSMIN